MSLFSRTDKLKTAQSGPLKVGSSTMQTLRGQPTTLGGALSAIASRSYWQCSRWIGSVFFKQRRARRLKSFNIVSRTQAADAHIDCGQLSQCNRPSCQKMILYGELKFCKIAEGSADVYPRLAPTCEWDTAAAQAVLEGAGGYVYDTTGTRLLYGKPDVLNPNFIAASIDFKELRGGA